MIVRPQPKMRLAPDSWNLRRIVKIFCPVVFGPDVYIRHFTCKLFRKNLSQNTMSMFERVNSVLFRITFDFHFGSASIQREKIEGETRQVPIKIEFVLTRTLIKQT